MWQRPLIPMALSFAGGIFFGHKILSVLPANPLIPFSALVISLIASLLLPSQWRMRLLLAAFFLTGAFLQTEGNAPSRLLQLIDRDRRIAAEGTVLKPVRLIGDRGEIEVLLHSIVNRGRRVAIDEKILLRVYQNVPSLEPGERIRINSRMRPFRNFQNPGRYDYESAMRRRGFACAASLSDGRYIVPRGPGELPIFEALLQKARQPVRTFFEQNLQPRQAALYRALILGERREITPKQRKPFNQSGLGHVLAVSGLHIGLVAWMAFFVLRASLARFYTLTLRINVRTLAAALTCLPVVGYAFLAGFGVSSQRAMIMVLAFLCSLILGREKEVWSTLAFAGLLILAVNPFALFSISFQLSFSAVIGILWLAPSILEKLSLNGKGQRPAGVTIYRLAAYFLGLLAVSFSASVFVMPITALYFHRISLVTLLANVTVVPILGLTVIPCGLLSVLSLPWSPLMAEIFLRLGSWCLTAMLEVVRFWAQLPFSSLWVPEPSAFEVLLFYVLILSLVFFRRWSWMKWALCFAVVSIMVDVAYWTYRNGFSNDLRATFLDVGQGNAAFIEFPRGKTMLIDGGGFPGSNFDVGKMVVAPYLWRSKIRRVDYLVLTHPQADHMNGLRFIAGAFSPAEFWFDGRRGQNRNLQELLGILEAGKTQILGPSNLVGGRNINGARIEFLHPIEGTGLWRNFVRNAGPNDYSLVLKISYAGKSFLFPGDLGKTGESFLVAEKDPRLRSDILLAPHHGSRNSSSRQFLQMVQPQYCVISAGYGNFFGFPHPETLQRLQKTGCRVLRIDLQGAVHFEIDPDSFDVQTYL